MAKATIQTMIYLFPEQREWLEKKSSISPYSMTQLVRQMVQKEMDKEKDSDKGE